MDSGILPDRKRLQPTVDRISSLSDCVLQHILSFIDTPSAARSSILSKRWRHLWVYTPALDFDSLFYLDYPLKESRIHRAMMQYKSTNLRRFQISIHCCDGGGDPKFLNELIAFSVKLKVQEFHFKISDIYSELFLHKLPNDMLSSGTLRVLDLRGCNINYIGTMKLASLEVLLLRDIYATNQALNLLISSCIVLKKFNLKACGSVTRLDLGLPELREMVLKSCLRLRHLTIDAPKLQYVKMRYLGKENLDLALKSTLDLKYAALDLKCRSEMYHNGRVCRLMNNLVWELGMAKVMKLHNDCCYPLLLDVVSILPPYCDVKQLETKFTATSEIDILKQFPSLEDLTFEFKGIFEVDGEDLQNISLRCLKYSLKRINIKNFKGCDKEFNMANFFIEKSMVLETMHIANYSGDSMSREEIRSKLMMSRASKSAEIIFT